MKECACSCPVCRDMCRRPCWPTPDEATRLIDNGYGHRLMYDWWANSGRPDTGIISPATKGKEGKQADWFPFGWCTFFQDGLCELHDLGLKPLEGRVASCTAIDNGFDLHKTVAMLWDNPEAQELCNEWRRSMI